MDHEVVTIDEFNGLFFRGNALVVPKGHSPNAQNVQFTERGIKTRNGSTLNNAIPVLDWALYQPLGTLAADRWIILSTGGAFFDSGVSLVVPIFTEATATKFSMVVMYGRAYISPSNGTKGVGSGLYVYQGTGTARLAAGTAPTTGLIAAASATAGNVETGVHLFAYAFETDSGFITQASSVVPLTVGTANFKVDLSSIDTGPAGTAKRHTLATKRIVGYTGRPNDYELFFIPSGTINDNIATTLTVNFFDADLVDSADYLLDELTVIPAFIGVINYEGCLVGFSETDTGSLIGTVRVSKLGEPESFDSIDGYFLCDPGDNGNVLAAASFRKMLYLWKEDRTFVVQGDLTNTIDSLLPSEWPISRIDSGIGTRGPKGVGSLLDSAAGNQDLILVAAKGGLFAFNGAYQDFPLSYKINDAWAVIDWTSSTLQVVIDSINKLIYVLAAGFGGSLTNYIVIFNYVDGLDYQNVKIIGHVYPQTSLTAIGINFTANRQPLFNFGNSANGWFKETINTYHDYNNVTIDSLYLTEYVPHSEGGLLHLGGVRGRFAGSGNVTVSVQKYDQTSVTLSPVITLAATSASEDLRLANVVSEAVAVKFRVNAVDKHMEIISPVKLLIKKLWSQRAG